MAYTTAADVKTYLDITGTADDTLLGVLVAAAQKWIETYCGRVFEAATNTSRSFDAIRDVDGRKLWLDCDLCSINSVTNGDGATVAAANYVTEPRNQAPYYAITLKTSSTVSWTYITDPENAITVSGKWAYSTTAPDDIVQVCKRLAAYLYTLKDAQVYDVTAMPESGVITVPKGMPVDVRQMLAGYRRKH